MGILKNNHGRLWDTTDPSSPIYLPWATVREIRWPDGLTISIAWPDSASWGVGHAPRDLEILYFSPRGKRPSDEYAAGAAVFRFWHVTATKIWVPNPVTLSATDSARVEVWFEAHCGSMEFTKP